MPVSTWERNESPESNLKEDFGKERWHIPL